MKRLLVCLVLFAAVVVCGKTQAQDVLPRKKFDEQEKEFIDLASRFYKELCTEVRKAIKEHKEIDIIRVAVAPPTLFEESRFREGIGFRYDDPECKPAQMSFHAKPRNTFPDGAIGDWIIPLPTCQLVFEMKSFAPDEETKTAWQFLEGLSDGGGSRPLTPEYHLPDVRFGDQDRGVDLGKAPVIDNWDTSDGHLCVSFSRDKDGQWKVATVGYLVAHRWVYELRQPLEYPEYTPLQSSLIKKIRHLEEAVFLAIDTAAIKATKQSTKRPPLRFPPRPNSK